MVRQAHHERTLGDFEKTLHLTLTPNGNADCNVRASVVGSVAVPRLWRGAVGQPVDPRLVGHAGQPVVERRGVREAQAGVGDGQPLTARQPAPKGSRGQAAARDDLPQELRVVVQLLQRPVAGEGQHAEQRGLPV